MLTKFNTPSSLSITEKIRLLTYCAAIFLVLGALLHNHWQMISAIVPLDYNEASQPTITATIASGENPYTFKNQPSRASVYPVLYNIIVAPFTFLFGNNLELHRSIVAIFIFGSCLLCYLATYKESKSITSSLASAVLYYAGLLYYSTPIASPNSTGLFFFLCSIFIPWYFNFSNRSLAIALVCGILAFYGKQYFIASLGYISLYLFIAISKKKAITFGTISILTTLTSIYLVHIYSPYFLDNTIFSVNSAVGLITSNKTMIKQMVFFGEYYLALIILTVILIIFNHRKSQLLEKNAKESSLQSFNVTNINSPLFPKRINYIVFCLTCSVAIIVLILGKNPANKMTYLFQIMSPFFLIISFKLISHSKHLSWLALPLIILTLYNSYQILPKDFSVDRNPWVKVEKIISENNNIYSPPITLTEMLNNGKTIYQNGHTNYFIFATNKPDFLKKDNENLTIDSIWQSHLIRIYKGIENQEFDVIILDRWTSIPAPPANLYPGIKSIEHLERYYKNTDEISLSLIKRPGGGANQLIIWRPKENNGIKH